MKESRFPWSARRNASGVPRQRSRERETEVEPLEGNERRGGYSKAAVVEASARVAVPRRDSRTDVKRFVIQMEAKRSTRDIFPDIGSSHLVHGYFCHGIGVRPCTEPEPARSNRSEVSSDDRTPVRAARGSIDPIGPSRRTRRNHVEWNILSSFDSLRFLRLGIEKKNMASAPLLSLFP